MIFGKKLIKYDFDNMENHDSLRVSLEQIFVDDDKVVAHKKLSDFLDKRGKERSYLGWDGNIYPKYEVKTIEIL